MEQHSDNVSDADNQQERQGIEKKIEQMNQKKKSRFLESSETIRRAAFSKEEQKI